MEKCVDYKNIIIDIEMIDNISGDNRMFNISFTTNNKEKFIIQFEDVWELRYVIENAFLNRIYAEEVTKENRFFLVLNSEMIKKFKSDSCDTMPTEYLKHFILIDKLDTIIEILTTQEPILKAL